MRTEGTYLGLTCILGVIIPKVPLVFLSMLRFVVYACQEYDEMNA